MPERSEDDAHTTGGADDVGAFGAFLRSQRQLSNQSLRQVAELARISNPYLSQIERGLHRPSVAVIRSLADALGLSVETLLAHAAGVGGSARPTPDGPIDGPAGAGTEEAIRTDPRLDDGQKQALLSVYRTMVGAAGPDGGTAGPDGSGSAGQG